MVFAYSVESHHLKRCDIIGTFNDLKLQFLSFFLRLTSSPMPKKWYEKTYRILFCSWRLEFFLHTQKKRGNHNPFFLRKQTKGHWCKISPNNSIGGSARHWLFPLPWRHISFPSLCFFYLGEFFPQAKQEQLLSGKWRLNFTWRFLPAWSSGTQVSEPASVSRGISPTASRGDSVFWKVSEIGGNGARSPWQCKQRRWGRGIQESLSTLLKFLSKRK